MRQDARSHPQESTIWSAPYTHSSVSVGPAIARKRLESMKRIAALVVVAYVATNSFGQDAAQSGQDNTTQTEPEKHQRAPDPGVTSHDAPAETASLPLDSA